MSINIAWVNEDQTVLLWRIGAVWTWEDFLTAKQQTLALLNKLEHPADVILDFSTGSYIPSRALTNFSSTLRQIPPEQLNRVVVVGANEMLRKLCSILRRLYPAEMMKVTTGTSVEQVMQVLAAKAESQSS